MPNSALLSLRRAAAASCRTDRKRSAIRCPAAVAVGSASSALLLVFGACRSEQRGTSSRLHLLEVAGRHAVHVNRALAEELDRGGEHSRGHELAAERSRLTGAA